MLEYFTMNTSSNRWIRFCNQLSRFIVWEFSIVSISIILLSTELQWVPLVLPWRRRVVSGCHPVLGAVVDRGGRRSRRPRKVQRLLPRAAAREAGRGVPDAEGGGQTGASDTRRGLRLRLCVWGGKQTIRLMMQKCSKFPMCRKFTWCWCRRNNLCN